MFPTPTPTEIAARASEELTRRILDEASRNSERALAISVANGASAALVEAVIFKIKPALSAALSLALRADPDELLPLAAAAAELGLTRYGLATSIRKNIIKLAVVRRRREIYVRRADLDGLVRPIDADASDPMVAALAAEISAALPAARAPRKLIGVREAAVLLKCKPSKIWALAKEEWLPGLHLGRSLRFRLVDVQRLAAAPPGNRRRWARVDVAASPGSPTQ